jgi:hypothetical protein
MKESAGLDYLSVDPRKEDNFKMDVKRTGCDTLNW